MDKEMCELERDIVRDIIKYAHDEHDGEEYRMYFDNLSSGENDLLFIRVVEGHRPLIYLCDHDDMNAMFVNITDLDVTTLIKVGNQIHDKSKEKKDLIDEITIKFRGLHYDVPANFAVPSIKDYILDKMDKSQTCYIGQVGLSGDEEGVYLSVFFPCKEEPGFSYDTPLEKLTKEELGCVLRNLTKGLPTMEEIANCTHKCRHDAR